MRRQEDGALYALAIIMGLLAVLIVVLGEDSTPVDSQKTEETHQETQVVSNPDTEETKSNQTQIAEVEDEQQQTESTETDPAPEMAPKQQLTEVEIRKLEEDYIVGYVMGDITYRTYIEIKEQYEIDYQRTISKEHIYQRYFEATEKLLEEMMESSSISDISEETLRKYNKAISNYGYDYLTLYRESILDIQGFQEGATLASYNNIILKLYYTKKIDEEQYKQYKAEVLNSDKERNHEEVLRQIEYCKELLAENGQEDISHPIFN